MGDLHHRRKGATRLELIPLEPIEAARGFVRGIDTGVPREEDRV